GRLLARDDLLKTPAPNLQCAALLSEAVVAVVSGGYVRLDMVQDHLHVAPRYSELAHASCHGAPEIMWRERLHEPCQKWGYSLALRSFSRARRPLLEKIPRRVINRLTTIRLACQ